jgi:hypothetical protein
MARYRLFLGHKRAAAVVAGARIGYWLRRMRRHVGDT